MITNYIILAMECVGTVAFAISGSLVAISCGLDLFGVLTGGWITAVGGGVVRDLLIGNTPPQIFFNPMILLLAFLTSVIVFIISSVNAKRFAGFKKRIDGINVFFDALGLAVFSVAGVEVACAKGFDANPLLAVVLGLITGVGGGIFRDVFVNEKPYILTKHIYAVASIVGCCAYYFIGTYFGLKVTATVTAVAIVVLIRMLAAKFRWRLPKIKLEDE